MAATGNLKRPYPAGGEQAQAPGAGQGQGQSRSRAADHAVLDGKRMRKPVHRQRVDYSSPVVLYVLSRMWQRDARDAAINLEATPSAGVNMLPPLAYPDWPASSFTTKFVHASINKARCSVNRVLWTPAGRERVFTGCQSGEFTLWNGQSFNFEWILQAHDVAVRSMVWSYNGNWLITGDDGGCVKYWTPTLNLIKAIHSAHKNSAVRDLSFSSTDLKFCSCSDDSVIKIWDFARCDEEERACKGHNWDVKSCAWHPQKSLIVSGGKDALVKLWDARTGKDLHTIEAHKAAVLKVKWNNNGNWVLTGSKDQAIKLFDIRTLKEMESYHGQKRDVTALAWHPFHEELFVSGGYDGSILYWLVGYGTPQAEVASAHEGSVWDLAWHPMGHLLCSGSQDQTTKFWCRHKPGEVTQAGKYGSGQKGHVAHEDYSSGGVRAFVDGASKPLGNRPADVIPGVGNMSMPLVQAGSDATWARTVETHNFQHQPFFAQPGAQPQTMLPAGVSSVSQPPLLARPSLATVPAMAAGGLQANHLQMSGSLNMGSAYQVGQLRGFGVVGQSQNLHPGQGQLMGYGGTSFAGGGDGQQGGPVQQVNWQIGGGGSLMQSNSQGLLPEQNTGHAVGSGLANLFNTF